MTPLSCTLVTLLVCSSGLRGACLVDDLLDCVELEDIHKLSTGAALAQSAGRLFESRLTGEQISTPRLINET